MNKSNQCHIIKANQDFVARLNDIKAKRMLAGYKNNSINDITKEICDSFIFSQLEAELIRIDKAVLEKLKKWRL